MTILPTSIRAKLTLTAVVVMGVLFVAIGVVVEVVGRQQIMATVDRELATKAQDIIRAHRDTDGSRLPPPPQPGDFGVNPNDPGPPDHGPGGDGSEDGGGGNSPAAEELSQLIGKLPGSLENGPHHGPGGPTGYSRLLNRLKQIGDPTIAVGPRFVSLSEGPPFVPPEMREPYDREAVNLAKLQGSAYSTVPLSGGNGQKLRVYTVATKDANGHRWAVQVPYPLAQIDTAISTLSRTLLVLLPVGLFLTAVACLFLMNRVMLPIRQITETADSISGEDLTRRLAVAGTDEFAQLGQTINGMLGRLEKAFLVQKETMARLEAVLTQQRRFTADASHELKTPLAVIKANTGLLVRDTYLSDDTRFSVEEIDAAATRMNRLVQGLMLLARAEAGSPVVGLTPFDLRLVVQNAIDQVHRPATKQVQFVDGDGDFLMKGSERDVERVFVNLIDNACRHTATNGKIEVRIRRDREGAMITVSDNGEGVSPEHLPHLFERFYRVDSSRSSDTGGTGLGLAICKGIVEANQGTIGIESVVGKGTRVTVQFPLTTSETIP